MANVKRHHHPFAAAAHLFSVLFPWLTIAAMATYITVHKDRNELEAFCSTAGIVPDRFLCTDIRGCSETSYWNSVASVSMNTGDGPTRKNESCSRAPEGHPG